MLQLKQREASRMAELAEEWRRRDREREVLLKKKLHEYQTLEDTLRKTLTDLEKRDKQLGKNEDEVRQPMEIARILSVFPDVNSRLLLWFDTVVACWTAGQQVERSILYLGHDSN